MYHKDFVDIAEAISQLKVLIDEIPKDMKSKKFFQSNRSLRELLNFFVDKIDRRINGKKDEEW